MGLWIAAIRPCLSNEPCKRRPNLVGAVFLNKMDTPNSYLLLVFARSDRIRVLQ